MQCEDGTGKCLIHGVKKKNNNNNKYVYAFNILLLDGHHLENNTMHEDNYAKLSLYLSPHHESTRGQGSKLYTFKDLGSRWRLVVSFTRRERDP
jgi:hypothetical protein